MNPQAPSQAPHVQGGHDAAPQPMEMRMILIAGADIASMREASLHLFGAGHMPVIGEWFSEPLASLSGIDRAGDDAFQQVLHPIRERLLSRCDAVLRVGGPSVNGDAMVGLARARGLRVFFSLKEALDG